MRFWLHRKKCSFCLVSCNKPEVFPHNAAEVPQFCCKPVRRQCSTSLWKSVFKSVLYLFALATDFSCIQIVQPGFGAHSVSSWMGTGVLSALKRLGCGVDRSAHQALLLPDMSSLRRQGEIYCYICSLLTCLIICLRSFNDAACGSNCTEPNNGMIR